MARNRPYGDGSQHSKAVGMPMYVKEVGEKSP